MAISKIIGSGLGTINSPVEFTSADNLTQITLSSTDADAGVGPVLDFYRNSASPADDDDLGFINFYGENDAGEKTLYGQIRASINDASNGTEDTRFIIQTAVGGTQETSRVELTGTETIINQDSKDLDFRVESDNDANAFFVEGDTGNIGMGTNDPTVQDAGMKMLHIHNPATDGTGRSALKLTNGDSGLVASRGGIITLDDSATLTIGSFESAGTIAFTSGGTSTRMRLDASGNLLVNCAAARSQNTAVSGGILLQVKGDIVPDIDAGNTGHSDLGDPSFRFEDTFCRDAATTGSDQNDKQNIAVLSSTEMAVAARISQNFKLFKWKDSVAAKGNDARTHAGTMAQDIKAAFIAEDLDASNYAMFMSNSWWEHDVEVDAVESNEDEGIIAADAYTRTDLYHVESEAPEGSTAVTRLGVRYSEVMSFLAAYNEQRFAAIETRLTALEG